MKNITASFQFEQESDPFVFDVDSLFYHLDCLTDYRKNHSLSFCSQLWKEDCPWKCP
jgi:hypothetical protein